MAEKYVEMYSPTNAAGRKPRGKGRTETKNLFIEKGTFIPKLYGSEYLMTKSIEKRKFQITKKIESDREDWPT